MKQLPARIFMLAACGMFVASSALASSVSGAISVAGTKLKTEGGKSDKHVVVYLEKVGEKNYPAPASEHAVVDQVGSVFIPHALAVQQGETVDFLNSDSFDHNVFSVDECCKLDLGNFPGGAKGEHTFDKIGVGVMLCSLHPEMAVYIVVVESPYFTTVEIDGETQSATYTIDNVPPGDYVLKVWNKRTVSPEQPVTLSEGEPAKADIELRKKSRRRK